VITLRRIIVQHIGLDSIIMLLGIDFRDKPFPEGLQTIVAEHRAWSQWVTAERGSDAQRKTAPYTDKNSPASSLGVPPTHKGALCVFRLRYVVTAIGLIVIGNRN